VITINHASLYGCVPDSALYYTELVNWLVTKFTTIFIVTLADIFTVVTVRRLVLHNPSNASNRQLITIIIFVVVIAFISTAPVRPRPCMLSRCWRISQSRGLLYVQDNKYTYNPRHSSMFRAGFGPQGLNEGRHFLQAPNGFSNHQTSPVDFSSKHWC